VSNEVLKYIPYKIDNFPSYSMPNPDDEPEWWENVWNAITGTLEAIKDFVVGCLVAFYNFLEHIGEILEDIGQAILNFLSDPAGAIQAALEFIIDVINAIKYWVLDEYTQKIRNAIEIIKNGNSEALSGYDLVNDLQDDPDLINEYSIVELLILESILMKTGHFASVGSFLGASLFALPFLVTGIVTTNDLDEVLIREFQDLTSALDDAEKLAKQAAINRAMNLITLGIVLILISIFSLVAFGVGMILAKIGFAAVIIGVVLLLIVTYI
jgi:hypothetical protein